MIYLADSPALCQLEVLANTRDHRQLEGRVLFRVRFDREHLETLVEEDLPANWAARPPSVQTKRIGDRWAGEQRSLALQVPNAMDPHGANILLNPQHSAFGKLAISKGETYPIDPRLAEWDAD